MKRLLALTLTLVLALTCTAVLATAEELTATVTVTVSKSGSLVLAAETVTVTDTDGDGVLTVSDALYAAALEAGADIPQTEGKVDQTFIMLFHEWFVRMSVPLVAFLIFFSTRARRERLHPETEAEEPLMTCAEYDALRAPTTPADVCDETPVGETKEDTHE